MRRCRVCGVSEETIAEAQSLLDSGYSPEELELHPAVRNGTLATMLPGTAKCSLCNHDELDAVLIRGENPFEDEEL